MDRKVHQQFDQRWLGLFCSEPTKSSRRRKSRGLGMAIAVKQQDRRMTTDAAALGIPQMH
jgi:hypothetical protein